MAMNIALPCTKKNTNHGCSVNLAYTIQNGNAQTKKPFKSCILKKSSLLTKFTCAEKRAFYSGEGKKLIVRMNNNHIHL